MVAIVPHLSTGSDVAKAISYGVNDNNHFASPDQSRPCIAIGIYTVSSVWAAWDSHAIRIVRYKTQMANEPVIVLFLCMTVWPLAFPWYVIVRQGIRSGLVPLKRPMDA